MRLPRVLIIAMNRINAEDTFNNGLLLRNLFGRWPRKRLAQIYSSSANDDPGFFGDYYSLTPDDRRLGRLFFPLKRSYITSTKAKSAGNSAPTSLHDASITDFIKRLIVHTWVYELLFRPLISRRMAVWIANFKPDIIFSQGYSLSFARLPVMIAHRFDLPVVYYPTDDWPSRKYRSKSRAPLISDITSKVIDTAARRLVSKAVVRLAFNPYMQAEYARRYKTHFEMLMHGDHAERFAVAAPLHRINNNEFLIVSTGLFGDSRLPLLEDLDKACDILHQKGYHVRAKIYPVNQRIELSSSANRFRHITFLPCPSHEGLIPALKEADLLFLPERFDLSAPGIATSISSKAHLFMFSERPIIVYSDPVTGIAKYARDKGWAIVVDRRNPYDLSVAIETVLTDKSICQELMDRSLHTAMENHHLPRIQTTFEHLLLTAVQQHNS